MCKTSIYICYLCAFLLSIQRGYAEDGPKTPEQMEKSKLSVIEKLKQLFQPSNPTELLRLAKKPLPPYKEVVKSSDGRATLIYRCRYAQAKSLINAVESAISSSGTAELAKEKNLIVVNDLATKMEEVADVIEKMDIPIPQLLVEAQIIEVYLEAGTQRDVRIQYVKTDSGDDTTNTYGFNLTSPTQNLRPDQGTGFNFYPYSSGTTAGRILKNLNLYIRWLQNTRDAKILSAPNILVDLGSTASIITGEDLPIQETQVTGNSVTTSTHYKRIGVKLNVTPLLINHDIVQLRVNPEVTSVVRYQQFTQNDTTISTPVIAIRNINTELSMIDGEILMLGGLYSNEKLTTKRRTPYLSDLPIIGEIFTALDESDVQKQLIFFLKMHVVVPGGSVAQSFQDIEKVSEDLQKASKIIKRSKKIFPLNNLPQRRRLFRSIDASAKALEELDKKIDEENESNQDSVDVKKVK